VEKDLHYLVTADTDIGIQKSTNQDSTCIKHARTSLGEIVMAVICDGMGGLAKGELASATVVRTFSDWFHKELPFELAAPDLQVIGGKWEMMLKDLNHRILEYGRANGCSLGTTFTGILMVQDQYVVVHVGDSRVYYLGSDLCQLTEDQTVVEREVRSGRMTEEQAKKDSRRNVLLQCVGASKTIEPQLVFGEVQEGVYLLCTDGFRHEITPKEICGSLKPSRLKNQNEMHRSTQALIRLSKKRNEKDNISAIVIKAQK
jgi:PPM family protein phosphatase